MIGDFAAAEEYIQRSLAVACGTGQHELHLSTLTALARLDRMVGQFAGARKWLGKMASAFAQPGFTCFKNYGDVALGWGYCACSRQ